MQFYWHSSFPKCTVHMCTVCIYLQTAPVVVTVTGSGATQNAGEDYTLTCTVSGGGTTTTTYQWLRNGAPLTGETSDTLSFTPLRKTTPSSNGQYTCQATRSGSTVTSNNITIAVTCKLGLFWHVTVHETLSIAPLSITITRTGSPIEGRTYILECSLMGLELLDPTEVRYRWDRENPNPQFAILRERVLSFDPLSREDEGVYRCTTRTTSPYLTYKPSLNRPTAFTVTSK